MWGHWQRCNTKNNNNLTCDSIFHTNPHPQKSTPIFFSAGGKVMRVLRLTNPPLHLPDCTSDKSLIWNMVLCPKCDWFMHRVTVSHNAAGSFYVCSEDELSSAGLSSSPEVWDCLWVGVDKRVAGDQWPGVLSCLRCLWCERDDAIPPPRRTEGPQRCSLRFVCFIFFSAIFNLQLRSV